MFNLEQAINEWSARMSGGGIKSPAVLDELESHLREEIRCRIKAGAADEQAFCEAVARMGNPEILRHEFNKVDSSRRFLAGAFLLWLGLAGLVAVYCGRRLLDDRMGPLLATHIFSLTTGYLAAFMAGGMAAACVCAQWTGGASTMLRHRLVAGSVRFLDLAAALVIIGFVLGLLWSHHFYGRYWVKDVREIGALTGMGGIIVLSVVRRMGRLSEETQALLGLGASLVVGFAWFGMLLIAQNRPLGSWWPMEVFAGFHFFLFALSFARRQKPAVL